MLLHVPLQSAEYDPGSMLMTLVATIGFLWLVTLTLYVLLRTTAPRAYYRAHGVRERTALGAILGVGLLGAVVLIAVAGVPDRVTPFVGLAVVFLHGLAVIGGVTLINLALFGRASRAATGSEVATSQSGLASSGARVLRTGTVREGAAAAEHPETGEPIVFHDATVFRRSPVSESEAIRFLLDCKDGTLVEVDPDECGILLFDDRYGTGAFAFPRRLPSIRIGDEITLLGTVRPGGGPGATHTLETDEFALLTDLEAEAFRRKQRRRVLSNAAGFAVLDVLAVGFLWIPL